jgi:hypothetical protein
VPRERVIGQASREPVIGQASLAQGVSDAHPTTHDEVQSVVGKSMGSVSALLRGVIEQIGP